MIGKGMGGVNLGPGGGPKRGHQSLEEQKKGMSINYRGGAGLGDIDPAALNGGINYEKYMQAKKEEDEYSRCIICS